MINLLIIEDDPDHRELIRANLQTAPEETFNWDFCATLRQSAEYLDQIAPDIILLDLSLPDSDIKETLPRALSVCKGIPIIVLTSLDDRNTLMGMIEQGAKDCIPKSMLHAGLLERSIKFCLDRQVAEKQKMDQELELQRAQDFHTFFEYTPVGFVVIEDNSIVKNANKFMSALVGCRENQLINKKITDFIADDSMGLFEDCINRINRPDAEPGISKVEIVWKRKENEWIWSNVSFQKIPLKNHKQHILLSVYDLTSEKEAEQKVRAALKEAMDANKAKTSLFSMLGHDIRSPAGNIFSLCDLLFNYDLEDEVKQCVRRISHISETMLHLIDDILTFALVDSGKVILQPDHLELRDFIHSLVDNFSTLAKKKNVRILTEIDVHYETQFLDRRRLEQVLNNFTTNALKFTESGGTITLGVKEIGDVLTFFVRDTGIGISEEDQKKLFQPFTQANEEIYQQFGGSGLGLSICKQIAETMQASIKLTSTLGEGSCFELVFNVKDLLPSTAGSNT